ERRSQAPTHDATMARPPARTASRARASPPSPDSVRTTTRAPRRQPIHQRRGRDRTRRPASRRRRNPATVRVRGSRRGTPLIERFAAIFLRTLLRRQQTVEVEVPGRVCRIAARLRDFGVAEAGAAELSLDRGAKIAPGAGQVSRDGGFVLLRQSTDLGE